MVGRFRPRFQGYVENRITFIELDYLFEQGSAGCASAVASATPRDHPAAAAPVDGLELAAWGRPVLRLFVLARSSNVRTCNGECK